MALTPIIHSLHTGRICKQIAKTRLKNARKIGHFVTLYVFAALTILQH